MSYKHIIQQTVLALVLVGSVISAASGISYAEKVAQVKTTSSALQPIKIPVSRPVSHVVRPPHDR